VEEAALYCSDPRHIYAEKYDKTFTENTQEIALKKLLSFGMNFGRRLV